ncbi:hypothetical protein BCEP4_470011 [Burkholderia cepacia]|nr:hypothetical protein BCEP4_470011 [Burkholderia cepacia]
MRRVAPGSKAGRRRRRVWITQSSIKDFLCFDEPGREAGRDRRALRAAQEEGCRDDARWRAAV